MRLNELEQDDSTKVIKTQRLNFELRAEVIIGDKRLVVYDSIFLLSEKCNRTPVMYNKCQNFSDSGDLIYIWANKYEHWNQTMSEYS